MYSWKKLGFVFKVLFPKLFNDICWSFTEFHRGGFLEIPLGLTFKFTIPKPLGGVLGSITLKITSGIADSKAICPDVCCYGCGLTRFFTTRQRDFLFRYRIFRKLRCPCRSRPVRAVVSLGNKALSRYHRPTFLACAREVPSYRRRDGSFPVEAPQAQRASRGLA